MKAIAPGPVDFYWMVVSELRQPLTSISGEAQLAQRYLSTDPAKTAERLDAIVKQITRIDRLLTVLHDRARYESMARRTNEAEHAAHDGGML